MKTEIGTKLFDTIERLLPAKRGDDIWLIEINTFNRVNGKVKPGFYYHKETVETISVDFRKGDFDRIFYNGGYVFGYSAFLTDTDAVLKAEELNKTYGERD